MGFLSKHEMQPILLLQSHEFPSEMGYPTIYKTMQGKTWIVKSGCYILEWSQVVGREGLKIILL